MSYCVNCGVELDKTCPACPLCNTPVYNPNQPIDTTSPSPFPTVIGVEEPSKHYEFTIFVSVILAVISLVCFLLNRFIITSSYWSTYAIGICLLFWIALLPFFFPGKVRISTCIALNGISIAVYLGIISILHPGNGWYWHIGLPVAALVTLLAYTYYYLLIRRRSSLIKKTTTFLAYTGLLCAAIELLICNHYGEPLRLFWSAVVLIVCLGMDIVLIVISFLKGVRTELRKRMHF